MFEYIRSTDIYKKISYYGFIYSVIAVIIYFAIPRGFGGLLIFFPFAFLHFVVGVLFIAGIFSANKERQNVPIATDPIYDIGFIIACIVILGPLVLFIIGCFLTLMGVLQ